MPKPRQRPRPPFDPSSLVLAADLRRRGMEPGRVREDGSPVLHQVRRGVWVSVRTWVGLDPVQRHAAFVHATALSATGDHAPVFSHTSALAVWGLPLITHWPGLAHTTGAARIRSSALVVRHRRSDLEAVSHRGLTLTPVHRTVIDVARTRPFPDGLAAADTALALRLCTRGDLVKAVEDIPHGATGRPRASLVAELADEDSGSPGESLSRAQMFLQRIPRPALQVEYEDALGLIGYVDFGWAGVVGEFDGLVKYRLGPQADADAYARVLVEEKAREDRIRAVGPRVARWVYADARNPRRLLAVLAREGIRPTPRQHWFGSGSAPGALLPHGGAVAAAPPCGNDAPV